MPTKFPILTFIGTIIFNVPAYLRRSNNSRSFKPVGRRLTYAHLPVPTKWRVQANKYDNEGAKATTLPIGPLVTLPISCCALTQQRFTIIFFPLVQFGGEERSQEDSERCWDGLYVNEDTTKRRHTSAASSLVLVNALVFLWLWTQTSSASLPFFCGAGRIFAFVRYPWTIFDCCAGAFSYNSSVI